MKISIKNTFVFGLAFGLVCLGRVRAQEVLPVATFGVKGSVRGAASATQVFVRQYNERSIPQNIDSVAATGGQFSFPKIELNPAFAYELGIGQQRIPLVVEGGEQIDIEADGQYQGYWSAKGSENMVYFSKIEELSRGMRSKMTDWQRAASDAQKRQDQPRLRQIEEQFKAAQGDYQKAIRAMIPQMGTHIVAMYATNFVIAPPSSPEQEMPLLLELSEKMILAKPQHPVVKTFRQQVLRLRGVDVGMEAPEIALKTPQDSIQTLSGLRGKHVLIDFWASWCGPCRKENPNVVRMYAKFRERGFEILGVSLDQDRSDWLRAIEKDNLMWRHVSDLQFWNSAAAQAYGVQAIPVTFLVDPQGKIIAKGLRGAELEQKLEEILR
jgi:peroxiredoxin